MNAAHLTARAASLAHHRGVTRLAPQLLHLQASRRRRDHVIGQEARALCGLTVSLLSTSALPFVGRHELATCPGCCYIRDQVKAGLLLVEAIEQHDELAIAETVEQDWPRCGDRIDAALVWVEAGFDDAEVIAWLEAGVPRTAAAYRLAAAGIEPREVGRDFETDVSLGLAFTRGDVSLEQVLELRRR